MQSNPNKRRIARFLFRWVYRFFVAVLLVSSVFFLVFFRGALYNYFVTFPKQEASWKELRAKRVPTTVDTGFNEYRGVLHSHSERSHDSQIAFPDILAAAKVADIDFIFMSDHCVEGKADYAQGWKGEHEGVIFVRGYEMGDGFMPWGLPDSAVLDCSAKSEDLAKEIVANGGLLFYAHSEDERLWDLPELTGMEIYNIHTDLKDEERAFRLKLLPEILTSVRRYPDHCIRLLFDRQDAILAHWDELNKTRKIVGISANDAHQNNGIQLIYTNEGKLLVQETSGSDGDEYTLNPVSRTLLRLAFGKLEPGKRLFYYTMDPYERSLRFVNTHLLAREFTEKGLLDALKEGRAFIAFDMIVDARSFAFTANSAQAKATIGEAIPLTPDLKLSAVSPVPCRFTLKLDGQKLLESDGSSFSYIPTAPGKYRIEAEISEAGVWIPWVYTNPIEVTGFVEATPGPAPVTAPASP
jgi:hypothetical protein